MGRDKSARVAEAAAGYDTEKDSKSLGSSSSSDDLSLVERNEKDVQLHPNQITAHAQSGQQKAEAAALVWSKKAVYLTYAWYVKS